MMKSSQKGFTLIELLVVIAIIGILAAVVLASLGSARTKGNDAAVKDNMNSMRSQAEMISTANNNSYNTVCTDTAFGTMLTNLKNTDSTYATSTNNTTLTAAGAWATITCHATSTAWGVEAPLSSGFWCVDSTGYAGTTSASTLGASDAQCN